MRRLQPLVAFVVAAAAVGGALLVDRAFGDRAFGLERDGPARSGAWFCPHGGGPEGWEVVLQVANPGDEPSTVRVRSLGSARTADVDTVEVEPGSFVRIPVPAEGRGRASTVEWFGAWVAVGWLAHAGGGEGGVASEPCAPQAGRRWLLPDSTTEIPEGAQPTEGSDEFVVVMNPFAREAVFSLTLLSERKEPVRHGSLTDVVLRPYRSIAFRLNDVILGELTVGTVLDVSVGRVAAATLGVSATGGIRSALGYLGPPAAELVYPGGDDAGRSELVVMRTSTEDEDARPTLAGEILTADPAQPIAGLEEANLPSASARTFPSTTSGASALVFSVSGADVASVRRTFGVTSDQAAVTGAVPAPSWVVLPTVAGSPSSPGLVLANPGSEPATVTLAYLRPGPEEELTITVEPGTARPVPVGFLALAPETAIAVVASSGTFVPASASYSLGREGVATYAVALGIAVPDPS